MPGFLGQGPTDPSTQTYNPALQSAYNFAVRTGRSRFASTIKQRMMNQGFTNDPTQGTDFNDPNFSSADATQVRPMLARWQRNQGLPPIRPDVFGAKADAARQENYNTQVAEPALNQSQAEIERLLKEPTFNADYMTQARSQIMSAIRGPAEQRQRSVAATLGLRGMDASSPAAMAVSQRAQLDADAELQSQLSSFGLHTQDLEAGDQAREAQLLTDITGARAAIHAGGQEAGQRVTALLGALRTAHDQQEAERAMARDQGFNWHTALGQFALNAPKQAAEAMAGMPPEPSKNYGYSGVPQSSVGSGNSFMSSVYAAGGS